MKKISLALLLCCSLYTAAWAQTDKNRTIPTKIADLLAKMPAKDSADLLANAEATADLGPAGLVTLASQLDAAGDNTRLHYALTGFSFCATQTGRDNWRSMAVNSYGHALEKVTNPEAQLFLITQLEHVGKDDAILFLEPFLHHERLSDPAARALATINSDESKKTLLNALSGSTGAARVNLVEALGYVEYAPAVKAITALAGGAGAGASDPMLRKVALHALAQIGDPASATLLAPAAAKAGYTYEPTEATSAYLLFLNTLHAHGKDDAAGKAATLLLQLKQPTQQHTRLAALQLLTAMQGAKSTGLLVTALKDPSPVYRRAALKFAAPYVTDASAAPWLKAAATANNTVKSEIVNMLAGKGIAAAYPVALSVLKAPDAATRISAINAAAITGKSAAIPVLIGLLNKADKEEAAAVSKALQLMPGTEVNGAAAAALATASPAGKAALLEVLGEKSASAQVADVLPYLQDAALKTAATSALNKMVGANDLAALYPLLTAAKDPADVQNIQSIVVTALNNLPAGSDKSATLSARYKAAEASQQANFFPVFAGIGGAAALQTLRQEYAGGDAARQSAIIAALGGWKDGGAVGELHRLVLGGNSAAINSFIKQIGMAKVPADQKLLVVRDVMPTADKAQQKALIAALADAKEYSTLRYVSQFLSDDALKAEAANTMMVIALGNKDIFGDDVKQMLQAAMPALTGSEADYQREALRKHIAAMPAGAGFVPLFNGKDLTGWKGLVADPIKRSKMDAATLAAEQAKADKAMLDGWKVENGELIFTGHGDNLCTVKQYGDFELLVDWKIQKDGDAGIYLRGTPQVQIWDTSRRDVGAEVGSGGLYNNQKNPSKPAVLADNAIGDWNHFRIIMVGDQVTVYLNGVLVVDKVALENYWDRSLPLFVKEQIELQAHGTIVAYRNVLIREIPRPEPFVLSEEEKKDGFKVLFDGTSLHEWVGNKTAYIIEDGNIAVYPKRGGNGNLYTKDEYSDFIYRFEFKLTPGANNGVGIHAPLEGDAAYEGMEIQILDNDADIYKNLQVYQYHGSVYGVIPARRGFLKPVGEWNQEEIKVQGTHITVTLNGTVITEGDYAEASKNGTMDHREHPGLKRTTGHIGFLGHGDTLYFRNIRVKDLSAPVVTEPEGKKRKKKKS